MKSGRYILSLCYLTLLSNFGISVYFQRLKNYRCISDLKPPSNCGHASIVTSLKLETAPDGIELDAKVEELLRRISSTDRGIATSEADISDIRRIFSHLSDTYQATGKVAIDDSNLLGNYDVSFVGTSKAQSREGSPAGGGFRSGIGRFVYKNEGLFQNLLKDSSTGQIRVVNYVFGKLFCLIPLGVILHGRVSKTPENERRELMQRFNTSLSSGGTVTANFDPPLIAVGDLNMCKPSFFRGFSISIGPNSSVVLDTTFLSEKVRLGVGSRGSIFVFKKTIEELSEGWRTAFQRPPLQGRKVGKVLMTIGLGLFMLPRCVAIIQKGNNFLSYLLTKLMHSKLLNALSIIFAFIGGLLVLSRGGMED